MNLKEIFENDKRGLFGKPTFIKEINECVVVNYYGQGDSHFGLFCFDIKEGWKFLKYLPFEMKDFSDKDKINIIKNYCL